MPSPQSPRTLIAGCGKGSLIDSLRDNGFEAYGFDISENLDYDSEKTICADVRDPHTPTLAARMFGVEEWDYIITEKLLSCLTEHEAHAACHHLRRNAELIHQVVPNSDTTSTSLPMSEWRQLCDPTDEDTWFEAYQPIEVNGTLVP